MRWLGVDAVAAGTRREWRRGRHSYFGNYAAPSTSRLIGRVPPFYYSTFNAASTRPHLLDTSRPRISPHIDACRGSPAESRRLSAALRQYPASQAGQRYARPQHLRSLKLLSGSRFSKSPRRLILPVRGERHFLSSMHRRHHEGNGTVGSPGPTPSHIYVTRPTLACGRPHPRTPLA